MSNWKEYKQDINENVLSQEHLRYLEILADLVVLRKQKGVTQYQLADMTGMQQPAIARFEDPAQTPNALTLLKVVNALGYDLVITKREEGN